MAGFNAKDAVVAVPHRSGYHKAFRNLFTGTTGTEVPILCDEIIPNSDIELDLACSVTLPPLAAETFMNVDYNVEAFFVPTRLLMAGYEQWLTGKDMYETTSNNSTTKHYIRTPVVQLNPSNVAPGTLSDYLGFMIANTDNVTTTGYSFVSAFPYLAYALVWNDWYRNALVQKDIFEDSFSAKLNSRDSYLPSTIKWYTPNEDSSNYILTKNMTFMDSSTIFSLRQRNFGSDYFTNATPSPQNGEAQKVTMSLPSNLGIDFDSISAESASIDTDDAFSAGEGSIASASFQSGSVYFTIASLRSANSMQQFLERNNICGGRLVDYVKGQYGANLKDSIAQRPVYLGSFSAPVYTKGIYQSQNDTEASVATANPFKSVGARYGHAYAEANSHLVHFHVDEPGYLLVLGCLTPEVTYSSGINTYLMRYTQRSSQSDMPNPILQNVGNQPIYFYELDAAVRMNTTGQQSHIFGYTGRYEDIKVRRNELHGLLRDGSSMAAFALQRHIYVGSGQPAVIGNSFLQIPTNYLDQVLAVSNEVSGFSYWADFYFDYKVSMPLYDSAIPSLQDPAYEHGNLFKMRKGGTRID